MLENLAPFKLLITDVKPDISQFNDTKVTINHFIIH